MITKTILLVGVRVMITTTGNTIKDILNDWNNDDNNSNDNNVHDSFNK